MHYSRKIPNRTVIKGDTKQNKNEIEIKDILIPLFSALLAVLLNQLFFESNRRLEAKIEYEKEMLRTQTPSLNRILAFTYKYELSTITYYVIPTQELIYADAKTGKVIKKEIKESKEKADTITVTIPTFVIDIKKRNKLLTDIESLKLQRDNLDHEIYVALENVIDYLDNNQMPTKIDKDVAINSIWNKEETQKNWNNLITELRTLCIYKLEKF